MKNIKNFVSLLILGASVSCNMSKKGESSLIKDAGAEDTYTTVSIQGDFLKAFINNDKDSQALYEALNIADSQGRGGNSKIFKTKEGAVDIFCTKGSTPVDSPFACTLSLNIKTKSADAKVYKEGDVVYALLNEKESKALFEILTFKMSEGRSGGSKAFRTDDMTAAIYCSVESSPVSVTPGVPKCTVTIDAYDNGN